LKEILYTWPSLVWFWIRHLIVPVGLGTFYDLRMVDHPGWANFFLPAGGVALAAALLTWGASRSRVIFFAAAMIIVPLLPFFDLRMFHHNNFAQDRFLYLPSLGLALMVGLAFRKIPSGRSKLFGFGAAQAVCPLALAFVLGFGTWHQSFYFENNWIFYRYNYLLAPRNAYAANDYGVILELLGMKAEALKVLELAAADDPDYRSAAYNLGRVYYEEGKLELAQRYLTKAIQIDPAMSDAHFCLGLTALEAGQPEQAEQAFRTALKIKPQGKEYHYRLGLALEAEGDLKGAFAEYQAELATNSAHPYARQHARDIQSRLAAAGL
jgi:tetratricopeptide (TPR) repeat protein